MCFIVYKVFHFTACYGAPLIVMIVFYIRIVLNVSTKQTVIHRDSQMSLNNAVIIRDDSPKGDSNQVNNSNINYQKKDSSAENDPVLVKKEKKKGNLVLNKKTS